MKVYLDMDMTVANFNDYFCTITGQTIGELKNDLYIEMEKKEIPQELRHFFFVNVFWSIINNSEEFWESLPLMPGTKQLWSFLSKYNIEKLFLSSAPLHSPSKEITIKGKRKWISKHFGKEYHLLIVPLEEFNEEIHMDKTIFLKHSNDILLDDNLNNIKAWQEKGGVAVPYNNNTKEIVEVLKDIFNNNKIPKKSLLQRGKEKWKRTINWKNNY